MNKKLRLVLLFSFSLVILQAQTIPKVDMVNTLMGTDSKPSLSNGNMGAKPSATWGVLNADFPYSFSLDKK